MIETQIPQTTDAPRRSSGMRRTATRVAAALGITIGVLATAGPSWAGPMMGC